MNLSKTTKIIQMGAAAVALVLVLSACAWNYGGLNRDPAVTEAFKNNRFSSDYRFYYIGRENMPYAIVGIREGYEFRSKFWSRVDPATETFREMVEHPYLHHHYSPYGAYILDSDGKQIGIWYSAFEFASIEVTENREVYIKNPYTPTRGLDPSKR